MVKVGPSANYYVRVRPYAWEDPDGDPAVVALFDGVVDVTLQYVVSIAFVPDLTELAPPWTDTVRSGIGWPPRTATEARLIQAFANDYVVTPNPATADTTDRFIRPSDGNMTTVFSVSPADFERYSAELAELAEDAGAVHSTVKVDEIRDRYEVIRYIETRILDSPFLLPSHAAMLERTR